MSDLLLMFSLAAYAFRQIRWNFVWALGYNVLCIPLAAGVFYPSFHLRLPPAFAGLAMGLSSVCVVLSSLSITLFEPPSLSGHRGQQHPAPLYQKFIHKCCFGQGAAYTQLPSSQDVPLHMLNTTPGLSTPSGYSAVDNNLKTT